MSGRLFYVLASHVSVGRFHYQRLWLFRFMDLIGASARERYTSVPLGRSQR